MSAHLTVLITAHNAARTLGRSLSHLDAQRGFDRGSIEIIVVDDRSTDRTLDIARTSGIPALRVVHLSEYDDRRLTARQLALDLGIRQARGDVVLLLDADASIDRDWCASMAHPLLAGAADVAAGGVAFDAAAPGIRTGAIAALQSMDAAYYLLACSAINAAGWASGILFGSVAFRREIYERVGGFHRIGHALTEDLAFARAAKANGARIMFLFRARVRVTACSTVREVLRRAVRTSAGGPSLLAALLGAWMLGLVLTAVAALALGGLWGSVFAVRYTLGVLFAVCAIGASGAWRRAPYAFVYETVSIVLGCCALVAIWRTREVEWGGVRYARHRNDSATA